MTPDRDISDLLGGVADDDISALFDIAEDAEAEDDEAIAAILEALI